MVGVYITDLEERDVRYRNGEKKQNLLSTISRLMRFSLGKWVWLGAGGWGGG
jgi:hypothetical protein